MLKIVSISFLLILGACTAAKSQKPTTASSDTGKTTQEDLSKTRPKYTPNTTAEAPKTNTTPADPKADATKRVNEKMDSIRTFNGTIMTAEGFRILIYNGNSSEASRDVRLQANELFPNVKTYIEWKAPSFKVKVGDFLDKLEAYYVLSELQKTFPSAILVPDKVNLRFTE